MPTIRMSTLIDQHVHAIDGGVGTIYDAYFSDDLWRVEHFVIETGAYFDRRKLIVDPRIIVMDAPPGMEEKPKEILVSATCAEILASPDYMADPPISEQKAHDPLLHPRFLWFPKGGLAKMVSRPMGAPQEDLEVNEDKARAQGYNPHLQSYREVRGYSVYAADDEKISDDHEKALVGHLEDFIMTSDDQRIVQLIVSTGTAKTDSAMVLQPNDVEQINWADVHMYLRRSRAELGLPVG